ncbi:MAG: RDD family protein [Gammaproteobacteria bacterium]|nr:RDD family protein [Gammaproteobacteria bacterium]
MTTSAPLRYRIGAIVYDTLLVLAIWIVTVVTLVTLIGDAVTGAWVQSLLFLEWYAFFVFFWTTRGQTLGMMAWRLKIHSDNDGRLTPTQGLTRFVVAGLSFAALGAGYMWMWKDEQRRTWADIASRSHVERQPR